jgi:hypothetical protein
LIISRRRRCRRGRHKENKRSILFRQCGLFLAPALSFLSLSRVQGTRAQLDNSTHTHYTTHYTQAVRKLLGPPDDTHRQQHNNNTYNSSRGTLPLLLLLLHGTEVSELRRPVRLMQRARVGGFHILFIPPATRARPKRNSCHRPASIDRIAHPSRNKKKQETRKKQERRR